MNMVDNCYVIVILFQSVLFVCAYGSDVLDSKGTKQHEFETITSPLYDNDIKTEKKLITSNEVVYFTPSTFKIYKSYISSDSTVKDETSQTDINLKHDTTSTTDTSYETSYFNGYTTENTEFSLLLEETTTNIITDSTEEYEKDVIIEPSTESSSTIYTTTNIISTTSKNEYQTAKLISTNETSQIDINFKYETTYTSDTSYETSSFNDYTTENTAFTEKDETTTYISYETSSFDDFTTENTEEKETTINIITDSPEEPNTESTSTISTTTDIEITTINECETATLIYTNVKSYPFLLNITWNHTTIEHCKYSYEIKLIEEEFRIITNESYVIIHNLYACKIYNGFITILYNDQKINTVQFKGTTSEAIEPVEKLTNFKIGNNLKISWLPSTRTTHCIQYYIWKHFQDDIFVTERNIESTNVIIDEPNGCLNNTFTVVAAIDENVFSSQKNTSYINIHINDPPIFISANTSTNSALTKWKFGKICKPKSFYVNFTSDNTYFRTVEGTFDIENNELIAELNDLFAFTNYTCRGAIQNEAGLSKWSDDSPTFQTQEKEPDIPENLIIKQFQNDTLYISWESPQKWNGDEIFFILVIEFLNLNYTQHSECPNITHKPVTNVLDTNINYFYYDNAEPYSFYKISVSAQSSGGIGSSIEKNITTNEAVPDKAILLSYNLIEYSLKTNYNVSLLINWGTPCKIQGIIDHYEVQLFSCHNNDSEQNQIIPILPLPANYNCMFENLLPDHCYNFIVKLYVQSKHSEEEAYVTTSAGIPDIAKEVNVPPPNATVDNPETTANVFISNNLFNATMGQILYYAIIVAQAGCEEVPKSDEYSLENWPQVVGNELCEDASKAYQATDIKWNPFDDGARTELKIFILGTVENCTSNNCNRPLTPHTNYSIKIRGFTRNGFSDTQLIYFNTASFIDGFQLGLIIGLIVGILVIAFIIAAALFYTRGKLNFTGWPRMESNSKISPAPLPVSLKKFGSHYAKMIENSGKIKNEFQLLSTISSDVTLSTKTAMLPINRKKNRYINILPYDQTRVKLNDTKITASDYINASYITGYTGFNEYIATQGPTESTCISFWQMIIEQNVRLIVMLTQCIESGKEKCYKYFPDFKDEYDFLNVIKVECIEEIFLPSHNKRTFKVTKGSSVYKIVHLQFNLWPDFGVPQQLNHIIEFCKIMKEMKTRKPSLVVMHCSAGVGRTGSLIAVDILMQTIRDKRKVDIFGTVLNLRKQRMNMVQSEVQYEFLYQCVNYLIAENARNSHSKIHLNQIEENQISESNML